MIIVIITSLNSYPSIHLQEFYLFEHEVRLLLSAIKFIILQNQRMFTINFVLKCNDHDCSISLNIAIAMQSIAT